MPETIRVVSFCTPEYREVAERHLVRTIREAPVFIKSSVTHLPSSGSWVGNCGMKARFILDEYRKSKPTPDEHVLWLDADAEVVDARGLLTIVDSVGECDVAVLRPDAAQRSRWPLVNSACLSGTILLRGGSSLVGSLLGAWAHEVSASPAELDQDVLGRVLRCFEETGFPALRVANLDPRFVCIPDLMPDVLDPVIVHRQASRSMRDRIG